MVQKWMKKMKLFSMSTNIDFEEIIWDILNDLENKYDCKKMQGYLLLYRVRVGGFRIVFKKENSGNAIILVWKRGDVYNELKKLNM